MKCVLHIGLEKTGTTTIQAYLDLNRRRLLGRGFLYTRSTGLRCNRGLSGAAYALDRRDDLTDSLQILTNRQLVRYQRSTVRRLKAEIERARRRRPGLTVVFSCEHLQSRLTTLEEIRRLKEILADLGLTDVKVLVYLRDPADLANSLYTTQVRVGSPDPAPGQPEVPFYRQICDHRRTLEQWTEVFGEPAVVPRLYLRQEFPNGSILEDFLGQIGARLEPGDQIPEDQNQIPSALSMGILRRMNAQVPPFLDHRRNPQRRDLPGFVEPRLHGPRYSMPRELWARYDEAFSEGNEWVRRRYFPERPALFPRRGPIPEASPALPPDEAERLAQLLADLWKSLHSPRVLIRKGVGLALSRAKHTVVRWRRALPF